MNDARVSRRLLNLTSDSAVLMAYILLEPFFIGVELSVKLFELWIDSARTRMNHQKTEEVFKNHDRGV